MHLTLVHNRDYARPVTANSVAGFGDPSSYGATAPTQQQALFLCLPFGRAPATRCLSMADRVGRPSGLPGSVAPVRQPRAVCHPIPFGDGRWQLLHQLRSSTTMANPTQVTPEAFDLAAKAYDSVELAVSTLHCLSAIFRAIYQAEQFPSHNKRLAGVGQYLADDWGSLLDGQAGELKAMLEAVREGRAAA